MKRAAEEELAEGANRAMKTVCTGERPKDYVCIFCQRYKPDASYKSVCFQYIRMETGEVMQPPWWDLQNLCGACYAQVPHPVRLAWKW